MTKEREELMLRIIDLCDSVRTRGLDPFDVRVREFFGRLRELLPKLKKHEDLYLDMTAVLGLADVINQQGEWIKYKSSMLYLDPLLISLKLHALPPKDLADVLARAWHPIVELENISPQGFREAKDYWTRLPPMGERWQGLGTEVISGEIAREELDRMGVVSEEEFSKTIEKTWGELKKAAGEKGEISYWDFIMEKTYDKTVAKAWVVSFVITSGYATIEAKPLEEEMILKPFPKQQRHTRATVFSFTVPITREEWERRRFGGKS